MNVVTCGCSGPQVTVVLSLAGGTGWRDRRCPRSRPERAPVTRRTTRLQVPDGQATDERGERVEPAPLMSERDGPRPVARGQPLTVLRPSVQRVPGERDEPGHHDRRPDHVEQFHRGTLRLEQPPVGLGVTGDQVQHRFGGRNAGPVAHRPGDHLCGLVEEHRPGLTCPPFGRLVPGLPGPFRQAILPPWTVHLAWWDSTGCGSGIPAATVGTPRR
jgi:hypothetical protein